MTGSSTQTPVVITTALDPPPAHFVQHIQWPVRHVPLITTAPIQPRPQTLYPFSWVFWTSPRAVEAVGQPAHWAAGVQHFAVGPTTAKALSQKGYTAVVQSPVATGLHSAHALLARLSSTDRVWWPCAQTPNPQVLALWQACPMAEITPVYTTQPRTLPPQTLTALNALNIAGWVFASPSAVKAFVQNALVLQPTQWVAASGPTTAAAIQQQWGVTPLTGLTPGCWQALAQALTP
jgi:uroporphyrinogen-III synthase